jgi:hypothetical protein
VIVVEGPDGAGKSTLVGEICERWSLTEGQRSTADRAEIYKTTREDTWRAIHAELMCHERPLVWDRLGPVSDPIYSALNLPHARECSFTYSELEMCSEILDRVSLVIVCLPPLGVVMENVLGSTKRQLPSTPQLVERVYEAYLPLGDLYWTYDYTVSQNVTPVITNYLTQRRERELLALGLGSV